MILYTPIQLDIQKILDLISVKQPCVELLNKLKPRQYFHNIDYLLRIYEREV